MRAWRPEGLRDETTCISPKPTGPQASKPKTVEF
jgi:hypothetical protein